MYGQGNNHSFRAVNPEQRRGAELHVTQGNIFIFNNPGKYAITWGNDVSSGRPHQIGQLSRNVPTSSVRITSTPTTSASHCDLFGASSATTSAQNQGGSNGNGNRVNEPTLSSIERPAIPTEVQQIMAGVRRYETEVRQLETNVRQFETEVRQFATKVGQYVSAKSNETRRRLV